MKTINPSAPLGINAKRSRSIKFYTLGCKVNQYDTQSIRERFLERGFKEIYNGKRSDVCVINTCTVTSSADQKSKAAIRRSIRENPKAKIIVTGCLAYKGNAFLSSIKGIDYIISKSFFSDGISNFSGHTRSFLKIQDGCNNFCSYCKVPLVRGRSRSRPLNEIIAEAGRLAAKGFKEIVLTGICLGAYGQDLNPRRDLVDVINELEKIDGLLRIRLSSIEAQDVSGKLIRKMSESKKLCRHLHIPIQSGDDKILKMMNRKYSAKYYLNLINKLKRKIPDIAITTDCLVGFSGETEKNFQHTLGLVRKISPLKVHIFPYSKREGTFAASHFNNKIDIAVARERIAQLKKLAEACTLSYKNKFLNKSLDVLFEGRAKKKTGYWQGHAGNYIKVLLKSTKHLNNQIITVRLRKIENNFILADL